MHIEPDLVSASSINKVSQMSNVIQSKTLALGTLSGWVHEGATSVFDQNVILTILVTSILMIVISIVLYIKVKKLRPNQAPKGIVLLAEWYFEIIETMTVEMFGTTGQQYKKIAPYFAFVLFYFFFGDIIGVFGFAELAQNYTIPLTNGIICLFGIFYFGIKHQRWLFLRHFFIKARFHGVVVPIVINPLEIIGIFTPIISLTFRLWGNIFASVIVISFCYIIGQLNGPGGENFEGSLNTPGLIIVGGFILAPLPHMLFDLFIDPIQAYVFVILNITYWAMRTNSEEAVELQEKLERKRALKLAKQQNQNQVVLNTNN